MNGDDDNALIKGMIVPNGDGTYRTATDAEAAVVDAKFREVQERCTLPPPGWKCTRGKHDGPCAALPDVTGCTRIKISGRPEDPFSLKIVAVRGDAEMPLDVDALAVDLDVHGGRLSLSWPACAVELDIDVRPLSPDERFDQVRVMLEEAIAACDRSWPMHPKLGEWKMWLKLHDLGRR